MATAGKCRPRDDAVVAHLTRSGLKPCRPDGRQSVLLRGNDQLLKGCGTTSCPMALITVPTYGAVMKFITVVIVASLSLGGQQAFAAGSGSSGGSSGGSAAGGASSPGTSTGGTSSSSGTTLSNGVTVNGTGGAPGANASNAKSQGTTGNNLGPAGTPGSSNTLNRAVGNLGNTNTGIVAPSSNSTVQPGSNK